MCFGLRATLQTHTRSKKRYEEAEQTYSETLDISRRVLGLQHPCHAAQYGEPRSAYIWQLNQYSKAERLLTERMEVSHRSWGLEHVRTLAAMSDLAVTFRLQQRYTEAEQLQLEALEVKQRVLGPEHPATLYGMANLAHVYGATGRHEEAGKLHTKNA